MSSPTPAGRLRLPRARAAADDSRAGYLALEMLARGLPLTFLPDLAWPTDLCRTGAAMPWGASGTDFTAPRDAC